MSDTSYSVTSLDPADLADLPPSAKLVATTLDHEGELTQTQLADKTRLSVRTVRTALRRLEDRDVVTSRPSVRDARHRLYSLAGPSD
ncbi:helix-turn-helix domain-containing protein [Halorarius halobius]|uniref:helix-turn-helix domain-containing protein n=1 Tax=Halorarius halobius TaxID=2962671 RepID=UPI0020CFBB51|nr:helix-turn-helix domain-containing protein [Halorarius halobius]